MALRSESAAAVAEEGQARAGGEHRRDNCDPCDEMEAMRFALNDVNKRDYQCQRGGNGQGGAQPPAAPRCVRGEKKWKPDGHREWAQVNENNDKREVNRQRGRPLSAAVEDKINYDQSQTVEKIREEKNTAAMTARRRRPL